MNFPLSLPEMTLIAVLAVTLVGVPVLALRTRRPRLVALVANLITSGTALGIFAITQHDPGEPVVSKMLVVCVVAGVAALGGAYIAATLPRLGANRTE